MFRHEGRLVKRRVGRAWVEDGLDGWQPRPGRAPDGYVEQKRAIEAGARIVAVYLQEAAARETIEQERQSEGVTFREVAHDYLRWLRDVRGAKRSTLRDRESVFAEPGTTYRRVARKLNGNVMGAFGDHPAAKITTREVNKLLEKIAANGGSASTVNKYRADLVAVFNYGMRPATFELPSNPALASDRRKEPGRAPLNFHSAAEIEALARSLADGEHRDLAGERHQENPERSPVETAEDEQDAELVRVASYAGLRMGELLALRWRDVDFAGHVLTVSRAISDDVDPPPRAAVRAAYRFPIRPQPPRQAEQARALHRARWLRLLQRVRPSSRRISSAPTLQARPRCCGTPTAPVPRFAPYIWFAPRCGRCGSRDDSGSDGSQRPLDDEPLSPRTTSLRAG